MYKSWIFLQGKEERTKFLYPLRSPTSLHSFDYLRTYFLYFSNIDPSTQLSIHKSIKYTVINLLVLLSCTICFGFQTSSGTNTNKIKQLQRVRNSTTS
jgi:hypothetical protein